MLFRKGGVEKGGKKRKKGNLEIGGGYKRGNWHFALNWLLFYSMCSPYQSLHYSLAILDNSVVFFSRTSPVYRSI